MQPHLCGGGEGCAGSGRASCERGAVAIAPIQQCGLRRIVVLVAFQSGSQEWPIGGRANAQARCGARTRGSGRSECRQGDSATRGRRTTKAIARTAAAAACEAPGLPRRLDSAVEVARRRCIRRRWASAGLQPLLLDVHLESQVSERARSRSPRASTRRALPLANSRTQPGPRPRPAFVLTRVPWRPPV